MASRSQPAWGEMRPPIPPGIVSSGSGHRHVLAKVVLGLRPAGGVSVAGPRTGLTTSTGLRGCGRPPLPPRRAEGRRSHPRNDAPRRRAAQHRGWAPACRRKVVRQTWPAFHTNILRATAGRKLSAASAPPFHLFPSLDFGPLGSAQHSPSSGLPFFQQAGHSGRAVCSRGHPRKGRGGHNPATVAPFPPGELRPWPQTHQSLGQRQRVSIARPNRSLQCDWRKSMAP